MNTTCYAAITEKKAYELSQNVEYDKSATSFKAGEDMRYCRNRHVACYKDLRDAWKTNNNPPSNQLNVGALRVCRQTYVDANPILWGSNVWSFRDNITWCTWASNRNAFQRRLIKKVHLSENMVLRPFKKASISEFKALEELNIDFITRDQDRVKQSMF